MEKADLKKAVFNLDYYKGDDLYSYGDTSFELLELLNAHEGNEKKILREHNNSGYLYQLSDLRENILDWYDFTEKDSVLEIGAGCGALTGVFCKKASRVVAIDSSKVNTTVNFKRHQNFDNLELITVNIKDWQTEETFDYVTLIGVLSYAHVYFNEENSYSAMIRKAKSFLKPGGKLIIAGSNKFGLKYFAGAREEHTGGFFDGIENYRKNQKAITFSKSEITKLIKGSGCSDLKFYYPIPDYKLSTTIYHESYLPRKGDLTNLSNAYDQSRYQLFDEEAVIDALCEDGTFEYFANSFLIFCTY